MYAGRAMKRICAVTLLVIVGCQAFCIAGNELERASLFGITQVYVLIEGLDAEAKHGGLNKTRLQTDVEVELRKAGIRLITRNELSNTPRLPYLYVSITVVKGRGQSSLYTYSVSLELMQRVYLAGNASKTESIGATWSNVVTGFVAGQPLDDQVRKYLRDLVSEFINDYLAVNPK